MTHKQRFGGEGVRLYLHVGPCHLVHEAGLAHVGETTHENGASVGIDGGKTGQVLADLLQVLQTLILTLHDCAHAAKSRPF